MNAALQKLKNPAIALAKRLIPATIRWKLRQLQYWGSALVAIGKGAGTRECPICGYSGSFGAAGMPMRLGAVCPRCRSGERHRLLYLAIERHQLLADVQSMLHFAPENCLTKTITKYVTDYRTADLAAGLAQMVMNIEKIELPDNSVDAIMALHVLEHVDDRKALQEIRRVLVPGGMFITAVPITEAWATTYENPAIVSKQDRTRHFGADDHRRWYGRDFRDRLNEAGFTVEEFTGDGSDTVKYGLVRGDTIFICRAEASAPRVAPRRRAQRHSYPGPGPTASQRP